jgi:hypothetical protein
LLWNRRGCLNSAAGGDLLKIREMLVCPCLPKLPVS